MAIPALITARRDSVRVPFKNRETVGGTALWLRAVWFARANGLRAIVDSDDEHIICECWRLGVEAHQRFLPPEAQGGTHWQAIESACRDLRLDSFVLLQPTSPFRAAAVLTSCVDAFDGRRPVLTCSTPGRWDGNIAVHAFPLSPAPPVFVRNPFAYSLQVDTPEDLAEAREAARWMPC